MGEMGKDSGYAIKSILSRGSENRAGPKYSVPPYPWFQDPLGYQNLEMLKSPSWLSVSAGSASINSTAIESLDAEPQNLQI